MNKKKFYIAEIIASFIFLGAFIFGMFMPLGYKPGTTPADELFTSICIKATFAFDILFLSYIIRDRTRRIKNPRYDHVFREEKGGETR